MHSLQRKHPGGAAQAARLTSQKRRTTGGPASRSTGSWGPHCIMSMMEGGHGGERASATRPSPARDHWQEPTACCTASSSSPGDAGAVAEGEAIGAGVRHHARRAEHAAGSAGGAGLAGRGGRGLVGAVSVHAASTGRFGHVVCVQQDRAGLHAGGSGSWHCHTRGTAPAGLSLSCEQRHTQAAPEGTCGGVI